MGDSAKNPVLLLTRKFESTPTASTDVVSESQDGESTQQQQKQQHSKLTKSILKLSKKKDQRKQNSEQRTEFAPKVSEFTFKGGAEGSVKVDIRDLSRPLTVAASKKGDDFDGLSKKADGLNAGQQSTAKADKKGSQVHREVRSLKARQPTRAPLVKHKEEKLLRQVGYNVAVDEVGRRMAFVTYSRLLTIINS